MGNAGKYTNSYSFNPKKNKYFAYIFSNGCLPVNHNAFLWYTKVSRSSTWQESANICVEEQITSGEKYTRTFLDSIGAHGVYHLSNIFRNTHRIKKKLGNITLIFPTVSSSLGTHLDKSSTSENILYIVMYIRRQIENRFFFNFSYDYLKITDGKSHIFGVYCGEKTGESIVVAGDQVTITFYSDDIEQRRGFLIFFTPIPVGR